MQSHDNYVNISEKVSIIYAVYTQDFSFKRRITPYYIAILSCSYKLIIQTSYSNHLLAMQYTLVLILYLSTGHDL